MSRKLFVKNCEQVMEDSRKRMRNSWTVVNKSWASPVHAKAETIGVWGKTKVPMQHQMTHAKADSKKMLGKFNTLSTYAASNDTCIYFKYVKNKNCQTKRLLFSFPIQHQMTHA